MWWNSTLCIDSEFSGTCVFHEDSSSLDMICAWQLSRWDVTLLLCYYVLYYIFMPKACGQIIRYGCIMVMGCKRLVQFVVGWWWCDTSLSWARWEERDSESEMGERRLI